MGDDGFCQRAEITAKPSVDLVNARSRQRAIYPSAAIDADDGQLHPLVRRLGQLFWRASHLPIMPTVAGLVGEIVRYLLQHRGGGWLGRPSDRHPRAVKDA